MNEQIEHCLYQAGLTAQGCWDELDDYAKQGIEKLAELIVQECCNTLHRHGWTDAGNDLQEHFGIEA